MTTYEIIPSIELKVGKPQPDFQPSVNLSVRVGDDDVSLFEDSVAGLRRLPVPEESTFSLELLNLSTRPAAFPIVINDGWRTLNVFGSDSTEPQEMSNRHMQLLESSARICSIDCFEAPNGQIFSLRTTQSGKVEAAGFKFDRLRVWYRQALDAEGIANPRRRALKDLVYSRRPALLTQINLISRKEMAKLLKPSGIIVDPDDPNAWRSETLYDRFPDLSKPVSISAV
jgi:hypothetical protein